MSTGYAEVPRSENEVASTGDQPPCYTAAAQPINVSDVTPVTCNQQYQEEGDPLPSYENATKLPTYAEVEIEKEEEARMEVIDELFGTTQSNTDDEEPRLDGVLIGSDCMFFFAFLIGFFFNWVGLFIGYFFLYNLAGRYGAIAGFGTSMIKWLIYLRYSDCCQDVFVKRNVYVYMLMNLVAFVFLMKGLIGWLKIRPLAYARNSNNADQHSAIFFY